MLLRTILIVLVLLVVVSGLFRLLKQSMSLPTRNGVSGTATTSVCIDKYGLSLIDEDVPSIAAEAWRQVTEKSTWEGNVVFHPTPQRDTETGQVSVTLSWSITCTRLTSQDTMELDRAIWLLPSIFMELAVEKARLKAPSENARTLFPFTVDLEQRVRRQLEGTPEPEQPELFEYRPRGSSTSPSLLMPEPQQIQLHQAK